MANDSGIKAGGMPFGKTNWGEDTGCRYQGKEIRVGRHWAKRDVWLIMRTGPEGQFPHEPLLDKPEGEPLEFEDAAKAWVHALQLFQTIGTMKLGVEFHVKGKSYMRIKVPNYKTTERFVTVLDLESFSVSEMSVDCKTDSARDGEVCEPSSSVV